MDHVKKNIQNFTPKNNGTRASRRYARARLRHAFTRVWPKHASAHASWERVSDTRVWERVSGNACLGTRVWERVSETPVWTHARMATRVSNGDTRPRIQRGPIRSPDQSEVERREDWPRLTNGRGICSIDFW